MKRFLSGLVVGVLISVGSVGLAQNEDIKLVINGQQVETDVQPVMINDRVMVPARFVAEPLGANVEWDYNTNTVVVRTIPVDLVGYRDIMTKHGLQQTGEGVFKKGDLTIRQMQNGQNVTLIAYVNETEAQQFVGLSMESRTYFSKELVTLIDSH